MEFDKKKYDFDHPQYRAALWDIGFLLQARKDTGLTLPEVAKAIEDIFIGNNLEDSLGGYDTMHSIVEKGVAEGDNDAIFSYFNDKFFEINEESIKNMEQYILPGFRNEN